MSLTGFSQPALDEPDYRVKHLRAQAASGLSVAEYCRRRELCAATFYKWRRLHSESEPERSPGSAMSFTEIGRIAGVQEAQWAAEIALASGAVIRVSAGADAQLLRAVFEALA